MVQVVPFAAESWSRGFPQLFNPEVHHHHH